MQVRPSGRRLARGVLEASPRVGSLIASVCVALSFGCSGSGGAGINVGGDDAGDETQVVDSSGGLGDVVLDTGGCTPRTCAAAGADCGPIGDGCGGVITSCGSCTAGKVCGGGGVPSVCGTTVGDGGGCVPLTCATAGANCGPVGDGCGGLLDCGSCPTGETCGGGGTPSVCGISYLAVDGGKLSETGTCIPLSCKDIGANCGPVADGCGGLLDCGTCTAPFICGGGGTSSVCGNPFVKGDAGTACTPRTCADVGANCGTIGDGCGGSLDCGTCTAPFICGGGGIPSVCGNSFIKGDAGSACTPIKTCPTGACGTIADGCGGSLSCGTCTAPLICGGGGVPSVCGNPFVTPDGGTTCKPKTCADYGANCGYVGDGCGGTAGPCGSCTFPDICGGGGTPSVCGGGSVDAGSTSCPPGSLCSKIPACPSGTTTTISGTVYAPNGVEPLYNAIVYVPKSGAADPIPDALVCDKCGSSAYSNGLVSAITGPDGKFTLSNVPAGSSIPIIIELGKWRRMYVIPSVSACVANPLPAAATRLPRFQAEGNPADNIPRMALATGDVDALECVLRKIGIDDREFGNGVAAGTDPHTSPGRIHLYQANGAVKNAATPSVTNLVGSMTSLDGYDAVLLACEGFPAATTAAQQKNLRDYTTAGGRLFATHFNYSWLYNNDDPTSANKWSTVAHWRVGSGNLTGGDGNPLTGFIDTSFPKGLALSQWAQIVGALGPVSPPAEVDIYVSRSDVIDDTATHTYPSQRWVYGKLGTPPSTRQPANIEQQMTWNTPVGAAASSQCGRVIFSDFHVNNGTTGGKVFPSECTTSTLSAQEKVLEFEIFDLASCVTADNAPPPPPPTCTPKTCKDVGYTCGVAADGCGGLTASCGTCSASAICGAGGTPGTCATPSCTPTTCAKLGYNCGPAGDGCGGTLDCGTCTGTDTCGGAGVPGVCGGPHCSPLTCAAQGISCGYAGDGCGGKIFCGNCTGTDTCGGGGVPGTCGGPKCTPTTCMAAGATCGPIGDGCGGTVDCGSCPTGMTCGGGGVASTCGKPLTGGCTPKTCADYGATCGKQADGCGGLTADCGSCTAPNTCGGGGVAGVCGAPSCTPTTCAKLGINCGYAADGCGALLDCGTCTMPKICGGAGTPNVCGGGVM
jgi:hypothetical protein